jgi:hypothetical protein
LNISDKIKNLIIHGVIKINYNECRNSSNYKKLFEYNKNKTEKLGKEFIEEHYFINNYYIHGIHIQEKYIPGYNKE